MSKIKCFNCSNMIDHPDTLGMCPRCGKGAFAFMYEEPPCHKKIPLYCRCCDLTVSMDEDITTCPICDTVLRDSAYPKNSPQPSHAAEKAELLSAGQDVLAIHKNCPKPPASLTRSTEWAQFATVVRAHVIEYTVPQYGDMPDDNISTWTPEEVIRSIGKRAARFGKNQRENQDELDLLKIAHEACIAYYKLKEKNDEERS